MNRRALLEVAKSVQIPQRNSTGEGSPKSFRTLIAIGVVMLLVTMILVFARSPAPARIAPPATSRSHQGQIERRAGVFVHVAGAVRKPGMYELGPEARVADAIEAAGGALPKADVDLVNLAQILTDGMKIEVPVTGDGAPSAVAPADASTGTALVSINSAGLAGLETLPGVGPVTAQAIISHREETGPFSSLEGLLEVSGIGPATFAEIRPHVTL